MKKSGVFMQAIVSLLISVVILLVPFLLGIAVVIIKDYKSILVLFLLAFVCLLYTTLAVYSLNDSMTEQEKL